VFSVRLIDDKGNTLDAEFSTGPDGKYIAVINGSRQGRAGLETSINDPSRAFVAFGLLVRPRLWPFGQSCARRKYCMLPPISTLFAR
jgi:hypothetical protein